MTAAGAGLPSGDPAVVAPPRRVADPDAARVGATRERLLDTAERLFLEHGYDNVSVRAINVAAGFNLGAVHYQFGSKQGLAAALIEARLLPSADGVDPGFEALARAERLHITALVRHQVETLVRHVAAPGPGRLHVQLLARAVLEEWDVTWASSAFRNESWTAVATRALPGLPEAVVAERMRLTTNLLLTEIGRPWQPLGDGDFGLDVEALIAYLAGGLSAPPSNGA